MAVQPTGFQQFSQTPAAYTPEAKPNPVQKLPTPEIIEVCSKI